MKTKQGILSGIPVLRHDSSIAELKECYKDRKIEICLCLQERK